MARDKRRLAIHEAGHAIAAHLLGKRINYITILADTGANKGGFSYGKVSCMPSAGQEQSSTYLKNQIVFFLASRAAEELFVGDVYSGVHGDMASAHSAAKKLGKTLTLSFDHIIWSIFYASFSVDAYYRKPCPRKKNRIV